MSQFARKPVWFQTRSDTNCAIKPQKMVRGLKFWILEEEGLYYKCSDNKGAEQLRGYPAADLRLCFRHAKSRFSHDVVQIDLLNADLGFS